ncbi:MAG: peptidylprolyl isomerase [Candidatus Hydrogenedentes bacterium]|nr:peptidylprolyl isomerase [Candidatus Hydrogenedentota bacterium]
MRVRSVLRLTAATAVMFGFVLYANAASEPAAPATNPAKPEAKQAAPGNTQEKALAAPVAGGPEEIVARVDGAPISRKDLDEAIRKAVEMYRQLAAAGQAPPGFDPNSPPTDEQKRKVLEGLVNFKVINTLAAKADIKVPDAEIDERIKMVKEKQGIKTDEELAKLLQQHNMSIEQLRAQLKEDLTRQHFGEATTKDLAVSDQEIETAYNKMKAEGGMTLKDDSLDVATILVRVNGKDDQVWNEAKKKIAAIRERVTKGKEDFVKVAKEVSEDPNLKQNGGVYPYVLRTSAPFGPDFGAAAFLVPAGEVSEPFKTGAGWHIVKVVEKHAPGPLPLENAFVKENIKNRLLAAKSKEKMDKVLADAKAGMNIEILLPPSLPAIPMAAPGAPATPAAPGEPKKDAAPNALLTPGST